MQHACTASVLSVVHAGTHSGLMSRALEHSHSQSSQLVEATLMVSSTRKQHTNARHKQPPQPHLT